MAIVKFASAIGKGSRRQSIRCQFRSVARVCVDSSGATSPRPSDRSGAVKPLWAPWRLEYIQQADEQEGCVFCDAEDAMVVARGRRAFVLLNKYPYASGHLMVAPTRHVGEFGELDDDEALEVHRLASTAIGALAQAYR